MLPPYPKSRAAVMFPPLLPCIGLALGELNGIGIECPDSFHRVDLRGVVRENDADDVIGHLRGREQLEQLASDGSIGSTTGGCWHPSETSHLPKPSRDITPR